MITSTHLNLQNVICVKGRVFTFYFCCIYVICLVLEVSLPTFEWATENNFFKELLELIQIKLETLTSRVSSISLLKRYTTMSRKTSMHTHHFTAYVDHSVGFSCKRHRIVDPSKKHMTEHAHCAVRQNNTRDSPYTFNVKCNCLILVAVSNPRISLANVRPERSENTNLCSARF